MADGLMPPRKRRRRRCKVLLGRQRKHSEMPSPRREGSWGNANQGGVCCALPASVLRACVLAEPRRADFAATPQVPVVGRQAATGGDGGWIRGLERPARTPRHLPSLAQVKIARPIRRIGVIAD